jgi:phosphoribosylamine--glycine ligase
MNVLLIGGGGREHALAWKLAQSPALDTLYAAPGNPGIAHHATCVALDATDHATVVAFAMKHAVRLVVIGPEAPLVDGLAAGGVEGLHQGSMRASRHPHRGLYTLQ